MMTHAIEETAAKMASLDVWKIINGCSWALRPSGCVLPYFCCSVPGDTANVRERVMLLEGWQTFHDFLRLRVDPDFSIWSSPLELPHFELAFMANGDFWLFRHDPGYAPQPPDARGRALCEKMLWEVYGVMMRLESDNSLVMRYAADPAMFSRCEGADGKWSDAPLAIPPPNPCVEKISLSQKLVAQVKDMPLPSNSVIEVEMRVMPILMTREKRPRMMYLFVGVDAKTGSDIFEESLSVPTEGGLRALWESLPERLLHHFIKNHSVPGEIRVSSGRLYRFLRPLCCELPFKLVRCPELEHIKPAISKVLARYS